MPTTILSSNTPFVLTWLHLNELLYSDFFHLTAVTLTPDSYHSHWDGLVIVRFITV